MSYLHGGAHCFHGPVGNAPLRERGGVNTRFNLGFMKVFQVLSLFLSHSLTIILSLVTALDHTARGRVVGRADIRPISRSWKRENY